jgi:hyperosmotically inducible periplasmic protein
MKTTHLLAAFALVGLLGGAAAGCAGSSKSESTGEYVDDSVISNKVRANLIGDKDLNLFQIDVTTYKGTVQLSGFVDSQADKDRASTVARSVAGVKDIENNLVVK